MRHTDENPTRRHFWPSRNRRGAMAVMIAICLPIFLIFAAFAIDVAYMHLARAELRIATDAAARAAGRTLSRTQSVAAALAAAQDAASRNLVAGQPLRLEPADIQFGTNNRPNDATPWDFTPAGSGEINAVRVTGRKTEGSPSNPVPLFLAKALGREAKPYYEPIRTSIAMQIDRDIILVVDRSGSMLSPADPNVPANYVTRQIGWETSQLGDRTFLSPIYAYDCISGTKWNALNDAVEVFLQTLEQTIPEEHVALASFDHAATRDVELTSNYNLIRAAMDVHTHALSAGGTSIPDGFAKGLAQVLNENTVRPYARKTVILMTDGVGGDPRPAIQDAARDHRLTVHTVTFGPEANQSLMADAAEDGGGRHWHADSRATLLDAYGEIAEDVPTVLTH